MTPQAALSLALAAPWVCLVLVALPATRRASGWMAPAAAGFAFAVAVGLPSGAELALGIPLWGGTFAVDAVGRLFLFAAAAVWGFCGLFAGGSITGQRERTRFFTFWLVALGGTLVLILARDVLSFYAGYAALTVAAYGLIIHDRAPRSLRAGRLYFAFMMMGEVALLGAVALTAAASEAPAAFDPAAAAHPGAATTLFLAGFAIKLGVFGAHSWLPRAHPVAPIPASAVLSGAVVKAGALGAWRVLDASVWANAAALGVVAVGLVSAAYGVFMGLRSRELKVVLAWSTVSQMGLIAVLVGAGLSKSGAVPVVGAALSLFAVHHGLAKASLFLGAGLASQPAGLAGSAARYALIVPAAALAGAPLTTGWLAKSALDAAAAKTPYAAWLVPALNAASVLTAVLMIWFVALAWRAPLPGALRHARRGQVGFFALVISLVILPAVDVGAVSLDVPGVGLKPLAYALWPLAAGGALFAVGGAVWRRPGGPCAEREPASARLPRCVRKLRVSVLRGERWLSRWTVVGYVLVGALLAIAWAAWP